MLATGLWLTIAVGSLGAVSDPLASLDVGADFDKVTRALTRVTRRSPVVLEREAPQALARALIDSGLLEAVNAAGCTPRDREGALRSWSFARFALAERGGARFAASFSERRRLSFLLSRVKVPVDPRKDPRGAWSRDRLHRLRAVLAALDRYRPRPDRPDPYGNVRRWRGRTDRGSVLIEYRPHQDEVWVLLAPRASCRRR